MLDYVIKGLKSPGKVLRWLKQYDYTPPGLTPLPAELGNYFPHLVRGPSNNPWVPHYQRRDLRQADPFGSVSWDEGTLLYNYGLKHKGEESLEIGCWVGWSTVILGLAGLKLTVVDPVLGGLPPGEACRESVAKAGLNDKVELIGGYSPQAVDELVAAGRRWSFIYIDGNHDFDAPMHDAQASVKGAKDDCIVLFHDTRQDNIGDVLAWMKSEGWNVGVHYTCKIIGVAWRGSARPLSHTPDPKVDWARHVREEASHLLRFDRI